MRHRPCPALPLLHEIKPCPEGLKYTTVFSFDIEMSWTTYLPKLAYAFWTQRPKRSTSSCLGGRCAAKITIKMCPKRVVDQRKSNVGFLRPVSEFCFWSCRQDKSMENWCFECCQERACPSIFRSSKRRITQQPSVKVLKLSCRIFLIIIMTVNAGCTVSS